MICQKLCHNNFSGWGALKIKPKPKDTIIILSLYYRYNIPFHLFIPRNPTRAHTHKLTNICHDAFYMCIYIYVCMCACFFHTTFFKFACIDECYIYIIICKYIYACVCVGMAHKQKVWIVRGWSGRFLNKWVMVWEVWSGPIAKVYWSDLVKSGKTMSLLIGDIVL